MLTLTSPIKTWAHGVPAGVKLASLCACTIILFALKSPITLGTAALFALALIASAGRDFFQQSLLMLRPLIPFVVVIAVWHLITRDPLGLPIILRMVTAVALANFVTMTTRLSDMITVVERLAQPFRRILLPKTLALAIALTVRFIPTMLARSGNIRESWRARAASRPGWRVLLPITLATLDDAEHVAQALRARGGLS